MFAIIYPIISLAVRIVDRVAVHWVQSQRRIYYQHAQLQKYSLAGSSTGHECSIKNISLICKANVRFKKRVQLVQHLIPIGPGSIYPLLYELHQNINQSYPHSIWNRNCCWHSSGIDSAFRLHETDRPPTAQQLYATLGRDPT